MDAYNILAHTQSYTGTEVAAIKTFLNSLE